MTALEPAATYRESLEYLLRTVLASGDADDAIADLDALIGATARETRERIAQEIEAALQRNLAEYPDIPAMRARRLGLNHAARIARADANLPQED